MHADTETVLLRKIFDAHEDCIKVLDLKGEVLRVNAGGVLALELDASADVLGLFWPDMWSGEGRAAAVLAIEAAMLGHAGRFSGVAETAKGTPKWWDVQVSPMLDDAGSPSAILIVSRDVTAQQRGIQERSELEALHSAILASSTDYAIIALDQVGTITLWNEGAKRIMQWSEAEILGHHVSIFFTQEENAAGIAEAEMATALANGHAEDERWHRRKDGDEFWANGAMMPLRTESGGHLGYIKILRDRTDALHLDEHRQLMVEELNHRVKNTLAVVQGIVSQTLRTTLSPDAARRAVMERLTILSRAQDILTRSSWTGAPLREVVETATAPLTPADGRVLVSGPDVDLGARSVLSLTMALHELGTNATKYGALSNDKGRVEVTWTVKNEVLELTWTERDGPAVETPTRQGFGSRLIAGGLARGLGGQTRFSFAPEGVSWSVQAPLAALAAT